MNYAFAATLLMLLPAICRAQNESATVADSQETVQPNVVIIMADDLGYRDLSCYGCVDFKTPQLDALAQSGVRCTAGYVSHPYCSPSRAGLLTGQYQQSFGHEHNPPYDESNVQIGIDPQTELLPELMRRAGYRTAVIGKWHLGAGPPFRPGQRGFDTFWGFLGGGHHYFHVQPAGKNYDSPIWDEDGPTNAPLTYLTDDLTQQAVSFIDQHRDGPFCLLLMYNAPHAPDHVTRQYLQQVADIPHPERRKYAALVKGIDAGVGKIRDKLRQAKLDTNTLVVFLSDNGGRKGVSDNRPLRGNKGWLHEGGIRVPMVLSMPGTLPAGKDYHRPLSALDLLPTAMSLASIERPEGLVGTNLIPFLNGTESGDAHDVLLWRCSGGEGYAVRQGDWKLVRDIGMPEPQLFDLASDLGENHDLAGERPEIVERLSQEYHRWADTLESPRWTETHSQHVKQERAAAAEAKTRQFPMPWIQESK